MPSKMRDDLKRELSKWNKEAMSVWRLKHISLRELGSKVWNGILNDDVFGRSAQLAYYFFFAIFPGLIFISSVIGLMGRAGSSAIDNLLGNLSHILPPEAFQILLTTFDQTAKASGAGKLAFGAITALWSATSGMTAAQDTLNAVYRVRETRSIWKMYLVAIGLTILSTIMMVLALGTLFYGAAMVKLVHFPLPLLIVFRIVVWAVAFLFLAMLFATTYYWAPDVKEARFQWITPGAVLGILGWLLVSAALRIYLHFFDSYSRMYGSLGAVMILLLWFYISGLMLLAGAEINSNIESMLTPAIQKAAESGELPQSA